MTNVTTPSVVRQIGALFDGCSVAGLSDRQLIERFVDRRDPTGEAAFAALVGRHGPMVLGVCRQLLGDQHHAEDAFQAVFLVLARKAGSLRDPDLLGNWLYGVALRTSRKGKARLDRRRRSEEGEAMNAADGETAAEPMAPPADQPAIDREQAEVLHDEIGRLPGAFRLPVVLCYFEGLTLDEAADRMRCPVGTLRSRIARARDKLRRGLTRRGVVLPAAALAAVLESGTASASVSSSLCDITTRAAIGFAAGQAASPLATALAREVLRSMLIHKLKFIALTLLFLGSIATGSGYLTRTLAMSDEPKKVPVGPSPKVAAKPVDAPAPGRMFVTGRVLDPQGNPVPNATVMASARARAIGAAIGLEALSSDPIGHASSDSSGRFRLDAPRTSSSRYDQFTAIAMAPGHGVGWVDLDPDADRPDAQVTLRPEQVIQGRLFDVAGQPASGVKISVWSIRHVLQEDPDPGVRALQGPSFRWARMNDMPAWPGPATTDAYGRFTLHGVGRDLRVSLAVTDPRFAMQMIEIHTDAASTAKTLTITLHPARTVNGRVTYADTGKPAAHALIIVYALGDRGGPPNPIDLETDAEGRFRVNPTPGDSIGVMAAPPDGEPYLSARTRFSWSKGAVEHPVDLALPRGVMVRGKVTEDGSGRPVAGATVMYVRPMAAGARLKSDGSARPAETRADGSFRLAILPQAGHLVVQAPSDDYVLREIGSDLFFQGRGGGLRSIPTPSSRAIRNRTAPAWKSPSRSVGRRPSRAESSGPTTSRSRMPG